MSENYSDKFWKLEDNIDKNNWKDKAGFYMIKITLLKTLFYELDPEKIEIVELNHYKERIFHRIEKSFDSIPEIKSVTVEERYLPYSVLYYLTVNDEPEPVDLIGDISLWILEFFKEYQPDFLRPDLQEYLNHNPLYILQFFNVGKIPAYRRRFAYSDLTMTTMEDIRNGNVKKDERKATFPGIQFRS